MDDDIIRYTSTEQPTNKDTRTHEGSFYQRIVRRVTRFANRVGHEKYIEDYSPLNDKLREDCSNLIGVLEQPGALQNMINLLPSLDARTNIVGSIKHLSVPISKDTPLHIEATGDSRGLLMFHATSTTNLSSILDKGLIPKQEATAYEESLSRVWAGMRHPIYFAPTPNEHIRVTVTETDRGDFNRGRTPTNVILVYDTGILENRNAIMVAQHFNGHIAYEDVKDFPPKGMAGSPLAEEKARFMEDIFSSVEVPFDAALLDTIITSTNYTGNPIYKFIQAAGNMEFIAGEPIPDQPSGIILPEGVVLDDEVRRRAERMGIPIISDCYPPESRMYYDLNKVYAAIYGRELVPGNTRIV